MSPSTITPTTDSGWLALSGLYTAGVSGSCYYRKINTVVRLEGLLSIAGTGWSSPNLFTLPAGYRPTATRGFTLATNSGSIIWTCSINSAGVLSVNSGAAGYSLYLDAIQFTTD